MFCLYLKFQHNNVSHRLWSNILQCSTGLSSSVDVIDQFTKKLVLDKENKWTKNNAIAPSNFSIQKEIVKKLNCLSLLKESKIYIDLPQLSDSQIGNLLSQALELHQTKDVDDLLEKCFQHHRLLSNEILQKIFKNYCQRGAVKDIKFLKNYVEKQDPELYLQNACFDHYLAKALYLSGNTDKSLQLFHTIFLNFKHLRSNIVAAMNDVMTHVVINGSEASLVMCIQEAELLSSSYSEDRALQSIWIATWKSERHSDQCLSRQLVKKHESLRNYIKESGAILCASELKIDNEGPVSRLLEEMLLYKMKSVYCKTLQILFNYRLRIGDSKGCQEIIKNGRALNLDIQLNHGKYIVMLINSSPAKKKPLEFIF